jgi:hypothetical protein
MFYRKLSFIVLVNNLIVSGFLIIKKNIIYSRVDFNKNNLWVYKKVN